MASPLLFFGDGSLPLHPAYSRVLQAKTKDSLLSVFLTRARLALQDEISKIPLPDRKGMPDLAELEALVPLPGDDRPDHQCLAPAMLVIIQIGQFISWYESHPEEPYPDFKSAITVGLCVGQLSAIAVSLARSLTELLPLAVESVRIAFRTGITATTVRDELERTSGRESWAMTVARAVGLTEDNLLERIHQETGVIGRKQAYVSASFGKALTIQGPPSTLDSIDGWINTNLKPSPKTFRQRIPIYTPYHAPHLYSQEAIAQILGKGVYDEVCADSLKTRLVSPVTGKYYQAATVPDLLRSVLCDVLKAPIEWGNVTEGCVDHVTASQSTNWLVKAYGPTMAAGSLVSSLKKGAKVQAVLDETFTSSDPSMKGVTTDEPIAIVGMAGRFPEATSHDELWELLQNGMDCHKVIPADRFDPNVYIDKKGSAKNPTGSAYACFIKEPGLFDARFFNMSPREAEQTDPQQRLALVTAYEALEMSGFVPNRTPSTQLDRIGTYYGQTGDDYREWNASQDVQTYYISGNDRAFGPGRINHYFKFGGPSMSVDTACSSSAVALDVACTALRANDCDTALVGGMTLFTNADTFCGLNRAHFLNETGNCKTFDDKADGYCRGEAVATVVIKRLSDAKADNDNVLAVILAAGTNYSAASASITHPHGPTQEVLYRRLLNEAGVHPFDVDYVEMHGTGTQAGDAAEMSSVSNVFAPAAPLRPRENPLWLSAVKSNLGHGESASGVTALIKSLLVLREQAIPPHVGIKSGTMNRTFPDLNERNIKIALEGAGAFPIGQDRKRRFLVNNFGAAGGNTALLLEEAPTKVKNVNIDSRSEHIINVTAKNQKSMKKNIQNLVAYLEKHPEISLSDLSYSTTARRMHHPQRLSVTASSMSQLQDRLTAAQEGDFKASNKTPKVIFTFTGQGSLYVPLAKDLFESSQQFRSDITRFNQICLDQGFPAFISVIDGSTSEMDTLSPAQTQLAITAVQMSLYRLWTSWGLSANAVIGHSLGEYAALFASGVLSANDTLYLVGQRAGLLQTACTKGTHSMLSAHADMTALKQHLGSRLDNLEVACVNGPEDVVLSGRAEVVQDAKDHLKSLGVKCVILNTPYAFHSAQVDPILESFEKIAQNVRFTAPRLPLLSPLLATTIKDAGVVGPSYLCRHAREAVDFCAALKHSHAEGLSNKDTVWIEMGPNPVCLGMVKSTLGDQCRAVPSLRKNENSWTTSAKSLSSMYNWGFEVNWNEYHRDFEQAQDLLNIPTYSFDEKNYWLDYKNDWALTKGEGITQQAPAVQTRPFITTSVQKLLSKEKKGNKAVLAFESDLSEPALYEVIAAHKINGSALCPAGVFADMALTVADYVRKEYDINVPTTGINVTDMEILGSLTVPVPRVATAQLLRINAVADLTEGKIDVEFSPYDSKTNKASNTNARCCVEYGNEQAWLRDWSRSAYLVQKRIQDLERGVNEGTTDKIFKKMAYQLFSQLVEYGPKYQGMQEVMVDAEELEATAVVKVYDDVNSGNFFASPLWVDNLAQLAGFVMNAIGVVDPRVGVYISHGWGSLQVAMPPDVSKPYRVHVKMQPLDKSVMAGTVSILQNDIMVGFIGDVKFQKVPRSLLDTMLGAASVAPKSSAPVKKPVQATTVESQREPKKAIPSKTVPKAAASQDGQFIRMLKVIAEEVGVDVADLKDDSDFASIGVDSLLSLTILSKLRETVGVDLPQSTFTDCQTVGDLKALFGDSSSVSDDSSDCSIETPPESGLQTPELVPEPAVTVSNDMVDSLHTILAEQIGVDVQELVATDDLSALGVDSLMSLSIVAALREKLGINVPSELLAEYTSLQDIKEALNLSTTATVVPPTATVQPKTATASRTSNSLLLQGNPKTATKTVFLFPDGSGSATSYAGLPEFAANTCVFAIDSPYLKHPTEYLCSLEEAAVTMTNELRSRQPKGPYTLAGWSAGGMYAYEAAKHLIEAGETVEKLILIDSPCRTDFGPMPQDVLSYVSKSGVIAGKGAATAPQWLVDHFQGTIRAVQEYSPKAFEPTKSPNTFVIWAARGVFEDWPKAELAGLDLSDPVAAWLLKPKTDPGSQGWEKLLAAEKMKCCTVDGNHFSMVHPPNCTSLSRAIASAVGEESEKNGSVQWRSA